MAKKNFKTGFDSLLGESSNTQSLPESSVNELKKPTQERRATFILSESHHETIKAISYWERKMLKDILYEALEAYINEYKRVKGDIQMPK